MGNSQLDNKKIVVTMETVIPADCCATCKHYIHYDFNSANLYDCDLQGLCFYDNAYLIKCTDWESK